MKSILLHIQDDNGLESRIQVALDLARAFDGHITCLQAIAYETTMPGDYYGSMFTQMVPMMRKHADELRRRLEDDFANEGVSWSWVEEVGLPERRLLQNAALHDIVVVGAAVPETREGSPSRIAGSLAIYSSTPLLVVPEYANGFDPNGAAMVCWNGSVEASNALRAAVPLLCRAKSVELVTVGEQEDADSLLPPIGGAEYLARHGVEASIAEVAQRGAKVAEVLLSAADVRKASYLVMGAYGRSRLMEGVFGGVTHRLLSDPKIPLFIAH